MKKPTQTNIEKALALKFSSDAFSGKKTIREYMRVMLRTIWIEGEGFSGKRPFGNSGWDYEVIRPLVVAELVPGQLDCDGYLEDFDRQDADALVLALIDEITKP